MFFIFPNTKKSNLVEINEMFYSENNKKSKNKSERQNSKKLNLQEYFWNSFFGALHCYIHQIYKRKLVRHLRTVLLKDMVNVKEVKYWFFSNLTEVYSFLKDGALWLVLN